MRGTVYIYVIVSMHARLWKLYMGVLHNGPFVLSECACMHVCVYVSMSIDSQVNGAQSEQSNEMV